jgi:hypothetical protein
LDESRSGGYEVCLRCGKLMPVESAFCNSCGADLRAAPAPGLQGAVSPESFRETLHGGPLPATGVVASAGGLPPYQAPSPGASPYAPAPAYHYYPVPFRQSNMDSLAIASLVCAVASFAIIPLLPAVAAIATGFVSRERIRTSGGKLEGDSYALAGILVGLLNVVLCVAVLLIVLFAALPS